ncbi:MAG: hypothetical protein Tsb009_02900 [Planctomycetaceae bacterium]
MNIPHDSLESRLNRLGLECDSVPTDQLTSAISALACFPMYMVANVHVWSKETKWKRPLVDIPSFESIREAFSIGRQERKLDISPEHRNLLGTLLGNAKPSDRIIYEFAMETLQRFLTETTPEIAEQIRTAIARMIVNVAKASGEGLLGTGEKINRHEYQLIQEISSTLDLKSSDEANSILKQID